MISRLLLCFLPLIILLACSPAPAMDRAAGPLLTIRFEKPEMRYETVLRNAVTEALDRNPEARFELVAVNPVPDNPAQAAISGAVARQNAERVLQTMTEMGLRLDHINLSYQANPEVQDGEVHIYMH